MTLVGIEAYDIPLRNVRVYDRPLCEPARLEHYLADSGISHAMSVTHGKKGIVARFSMNRYSVRVKAN